MHRRVAVFIDYQNCYRVARETFHDDTQDPPSLGNIRPMALASLLAGKGEGPFQLAVVGVYSGIANPRKDPRTHAARERQILEWTRSGAKVFTRPLWYPPDWALVRGAKPREKGIDVKLALDAVGGAIRDQYDTAIIASCDTDLDPVVEELLDLAHVVGKPSSVEAIAWRGRKNKLTQVAGLVYRWIGERDYRAIQDHLDYNLADRVRI